MRTAAGWVATPLLVVLVAVELTDLVFAIDSVPAILAITTNTWIVFAADAFALIGLGDSLAPRAHQATHLRDPAGRAGPPHAPQAPDEPHLTAPSEGRHRALGA